MTAVKAEEEGICVSGIFVLYIIIIAAAAIAGIVFILRSSGRVKPLPAVLAVVLAGTAAAVCAYGSQAGTLYAKAEGDPQAIVQTFFDTVCVGDYDTAYACLENYSSLGLENTPSSELGRLVYDALKKSYSYELQGGAEVDKLTAKQNVSFTYLDLRAMETDVETETGSVLEQMVRSRKRSEIYDSDDNFLPAVTDEAYETAVKNVLANAADYYRTDDLTVTLDYIDRQWVINADGSLLGALAGGTA